MLTKKIRFSSPFSLLNDFPFAVQSEVVRGIVGFVPAATELYRYINPRKDWKKDVKVFTAERNKEGRRVWCRPCRSVAFGSRLPDIVVVIRQATLLRCCKPNASKAPQIHQKYPNDYRFPTGESTRLQFCTIENFFKIPHSHTFLGGQTATKTTLFSGQVVVVQPPMNLFRAHFFDSPKCDIFNNDNKI